MALSQISSVPLMSWRQTAEAVYVNIENECRDFDYTANEYMFHFVALGAVRPRKYYEFNLYFLRPINRRHIFVRNIGHYLQFIIFKAELGPNLLKLTDSKGQMHPLRLAISHSKSEEQRKNQADGKEYKRFLVDLHEQSMKLQKLLDDARERSRNRLLNMLKAT